MGQPHMFAPVYLTTNVTGNRDQLFEFLPNAHALRCYQSDLHLSYNIRYDHVHNGVGVGCITQDNTRKQQFRAVSIPWMN